jgi:hypothetical protein
MVVLAADDSPFAPGLDRATRPVDVALETTFSCCLQDELQDFGVLPDGCTRDLSDLVLEQSVVPIGDRRYPADAA